MYRIKDQLFQTIEEAGKAYCPGARIVRDDGSSLSSREVNHALAAWLKGKRRTALCLKDRPCAICIAVEFFKGGVLTTRIEKLKPGWCECDIPNPRPDLGDPAVCYYCARWIKK